MRSNSRAVEHQPLFSDKGYHMKNDKIKAEHSYYALLSQYFMVNIIKNYKMIIKINKDGYYDKVF